MLVLLLYLVWCRRLFLHHSRRCNFVTVRRLTLTDMLLDIALLLPIRQVSLEPIFYNCVLYNIFWVLVSKVSQHKNYSVNHIKRDAMIDSHVRHLDYYRWELNLVWVWDAVVHGPFGAWLCHLEVMVIIEGIAHVLKVVLPCGAYYDLLKWIIVAQVYTLQTMGIVLNWLHRQIEELQVYEYLSQIILDFICAVVLIILKCIQVSRL